MRKKKWCKPRIPPDSSITITFIVHYRGCCPSAHNCQNCYTTESRILTISLSHNLTISHLTISRTTELPPNWHKKGKGEGGGSRSSGTSDQPQRVWKDPGVPIWEGDNIRAATQFENAPHFRGGEGYFKRFCGFMKAWWAIEEGFW